jgi:hypothetical protein
VIELTYDMTLRYVADSINEKDLDYIYPRPDGEGCYYVHSVNHEMVAGCLVGHVLHRAGVTLGELHLREGAVSDLIKSLKASEILTMDEKSRQYLIILQAIQDGGTPWGKASSPAATAVLYL